MILSNNRGQNSGYKKQSVCAIDKTNLLQKIYTGSEKGGTPVSRYTHTYRSVRAGLTSV